MKTIRELLSGKAPVALPGSTSVLEAARTMHAEGVGAMLVASPGKAPEGLFTERDLMIRVVVPGLDPATARLEEVMTRDIFTASPERRVNEVAREMQERHIRHLPVVEDGLCIGVLGLRDLLREHLNAKKDEVRDLTAYIQGGPTDA